ncbi:hypothetical protein V9T40_005254 [Parthenolecanium corni]|uniref:Uncharacterized protein n=1 Tax=Parthenolecanium corni TaxID=536013 RepID=A0AAN9TFI2_9HEMI
MTVLNSKSHNTTKTGIPKRAKRVPMNGRQDGECRKQNKSEAGAEKVEKRLPAICAQISMSPSSLGAPSLLPHRQ